MAINEFPYGQTISVAAMSDANVTPLTGVGQVIDGYTVQPGVKILLQNQTNPLENGVWVVPSSDNPTRAWVMDPNLSTISQLIPGKTIYIENGTVYGGMVAILGNQAVGGVIAQVWTAASAALAAAVAANAAAIAANTVLIMANVAAIANIQLARTAVAVDVTATGDAIGAATETLHAAVGAASAHITAKNLIHTLVQLQCPSDNAADTWRVRLRLGTGAGMAGRPLIIDSGAFDLTTGSGMFIEAWTQIRVEGAPGTFRSHARLYNEVGPVLVEDIVVGNIDTTIDTNAFTITAESSTNNAAQQMTLELLQATFQLV